MEGGTVAEVVESRDDSLRPGDIVLSHVGWQSYGVPRPSTCASSIPPGADLDRSGRPRDDRLHRVRRAARDRQAPARRDGRGGGRRRTGRFGGRPDRAHQGRPRCRHRGRPGQGGLARGARLRRRARPPLADVRRRPQGRRARWHRRLLRERRRPRVGRRPAAPQHVRPGAGVRPRRALQRDRAAARPGPLVAAHAHDPDQEPHGRGFIQTEFVKTHYASVPGGCRRLVARRHAAPSRGRGRGTRERPEAFAGLLKGKSFGKLLVQVGDDPTRTSQPATAG